MVTPRSPPPVTLSSGAPNSIAMNSEEEELKEEILAIWSQRILIPGETPELSTDQDNVHP